MLAKLSGRTRTITIVVAVLLVAAVLVASIPVTRGAVQQAACSLVGVGCPGLPHPVPPDDDRDWRLELSPVEAATWGYYAALGDSFSSGHGADDYADTTDRDTDCYRSANAYPRLLADDFDFAGDLRFLACSNERGARMLEDLGTQSQLDEIVPQTSLLTISIGGNDLAWSRVMQTCMLRVPIVDRYGCVNQGSDVEERMAQFADTLDELLVEIRQRAPDARVLFVGYPRLFPENPDGMYYTLNAADQDWLNEMAVKLNDQIAEAVADADADITGADSVGSVEFVDVYDALDGHEVNSDDPWIHGVLLDRGEARPIDVNRSTFHPTVEGQVAIGEEVDAQVTSGPDRPLYVTRELVDGLTPEALAAN